jgi:hypothetical protein
MNMTGSKLTELLVAATLAARRLDLRKDNSVPNGDCCQVGCIVIWLK